METDLVFFSNSGSEAIETAIKSLWLLNTLEGRPQKRKIISRTNAYHGVTIFANSLLGQSYAEHFGDRDDKVIFVECPHYSQETRAIMTEQQFVESLIKNLIKTIETEGPENIAAFVAEPIMGVGGVIIPPTDYFRNVREILKGYDIHLIADEIICGIMRTGKFWGSQTVHAKPDIVVSSKCLTAGFFPLGATLYSSELGSRMLDVCKKIDEFPHAHTTSGHPTGCRVALKVLEILQREEFLKEYVNKCQCFEKLANDLKALDSVGEVRATGLLAGFDITLAECGSDQDISRTDLVMREIDQRCRERGIIFRFKGRSVLCAPPYTSSATELSTIFEVLSSSIQEVTERSTFA